MTENHSEPGNGSKNEGNDSETGKPLGVSRENLLEALLPAIEEAKRKIEAGRVYDAENEKVRQGWIKALGYAVNAANSVLKDKDLEEIQARVEALEEQREEIIQYG